MENPKLNAYLELREELRRRRADTITNLEDVIRYVGRHLDAVDWEIDELMRQFNHPARHVLGRSLRVYWGEMPADRALGPAGVDWYVVHADGRRERMRRPQVRYLPRYTTPAFLPFQSAALERLTDYLAIRSAAREAMRNLVPLVRRAEVASIPGPQPSPAVTARYRAALISDVATMVREAGEALELIDRELDEMMQRFNQLTKRPRVSIVCRWEVSEKAVGPFSGPAGPTFFMATAGLGGRRMARMTSPKGPDENPISSRELERAKYNKNPDEIGRLAAEITMLRVRRRSYTSTLKATARAVAALHRIKMEPET
ncbi:hypothetical protein E4T66_18405 [Sinimarinibacterium sp. CAU 1509]|uniref:hypothetical protein n=1 Tax=Sinimarinibacterium sp. CAU 1509 TaxID=2562283 RepID=UPI0010AC013C|nr:hypothetical protein [Sinimarinibacterium sp. CAU 1509]TJY57379.1 hypothetical protein E4T66_18405 [Sinimarinibacterium sp. CAU 1509]